MNFIQALYLNLISIQGLTFSGKYAWSKKLNVESFALKPIINTHTKQPLGIVEGNLTSC